MQMLQSMDAPLATGDSDLVQRFGCSVSFVLTDPSCLRFTSPGIEGVIPYRLGVRSVVGIGDPVCPPDEADRLADEFREAAARRGWSTVFVAAGRRFTEASVARGLAAIEWGEDLIFDPRLDPAAGHRGRELRKNLNRASRASVTVEELRDPSLEPELDELAKRWLPRGARTFLAPVDLFGQRRGHRWFYARTPGQLAGVLSMGRLDTLGGWVFEHLLAAAQAPTGTTETLVTHALQTLGDEGCGCATFGPSPSRRLGRMEGVGPTTQRFANTFYEGARRLLGFDSISRYRMKFASVRSEPRFLLFHPRRIGFSHAMGILRAFNVRLV